MTVLQIPLNATPAQTLNAVTLGNQSCKINVYQKRTGLFLDLYVSNALIIGGVICRDRVWMVQDAYFGFVGDLGFVDTQGLADPDYTGLGTRFQLIWQG